MKKTLLFIFSIVLAYSQLNSQNLRVFNNNGTEDIQGDTITFWFADDPTIDEGATDFEAKNFAKIYNASNGTMTILLERKANSFIQGSEDYACWGTNCWGGNDPSVTPVWDIPDNVVASSRDTAGGVPLILYFDFNNNTGEAIYNYKWYSQENPSDSASIYIRWSVSTLSNLNDIAQAVQNMEVYPNPATDHFTVDLNNGINIDNQEIIIRDMLGKTVRRENIGSLQEKFVFSTSEMQGGIYFVSYVAEGEVLKTNKLVIR